MWRYVAKRLLIAIPTILVVSLIVFLILHLAPGDPARLIAGEEATAEQVEAIRRELGLDRPLYEQYFTFLGRMLRGDFGKSTLTKRPVLEEIAPRWINTIKLAMASTIVCVAIGLLAGIIASTHPHTVFDNLSMFGALIGVSTPIFWLGLILILIFSVMLNWLPAGGTGGLEHLILPAITLGAATSAVVARMTRTSMLEIIEQDFVRTLKAYGLGHRSVVYKHVLRNALIPIVTVIGLQFGYVLGGAVLTETVFAWPGIGRLIVSSIFARDYPVVQGGIMLVAVTFIFVNLGVDLLYAVIDPRIRYR
jgi:ABC-type dipeptide/oligopeptide/nickel transport system permease component